MGDTKVSKQEANGVNISNGKHEEDAIPRLTLSSWATGENAEKVKVTIAQFKEKFGVKPTFYIRVPGRYIGINIKKYFTEELNFI